MSDSDEPITLVMVDDDLTDQYIVKRSLRHLSFPVRLLTFDAGDSFVNVLKDADLLAENFGSASLPILVLLDIRMPRMSGFEVLEELKKVLVDRPGMLAVAMHSSSNNAGDRARAFSYDFVDGYLVKPIALAELEAYLQQHYSDT